MTETKFEKSIPYMQSAAETGLLSTKDSAFFGICLRKDWQKQGSGSYSKQYK